MPAPTTWGPMTMKLTRTITAVFLGGPKDRQVIEVEGDLPEIEVQELDPPDFGVGAATFGSLIYSRIRRYRRRDLHSGGREHRLYVCDDVADDEIATRLAADYANIRPGAAPESGPKLTPEQSDRRDQAAKRLPPYQAGRKFRGVPVDHFRRDELLRIVAHLDKQLAALRRERIDLAARWLEEPL
jgi:hypothetical protein